ncbi:MAG: SDR family oxidoreductase [Proteobacteria bacterium]|nr:SDR family oxidoreductase [Pseudomonadota bacterium]MBI3499123.1 SDR family oxidoreductase [Pseudomonadota bacterium]
MKVVITGGGGFLGRKLARRLLAKGTLLGPSGKEETIDRLVLFDVVEAPPLAEGDNRVEAVAGDVSDRATMRRVIDGDTAAVFHFAGVVSAGAEADFDLGYRVNLDGTLAVLEACRALPKPARLVFTSSLATYGGEWSEAVDDATPQTPQTSYGAQKTIGELLVNDYSRKGFVDGRSLKLPTIVVRPGKPNKAASTFVSSIIREPLQGQRAICPVGREVRMAMLSPRRTVDAFIRAHDLPGSAWGPWRSTNLPAITVSIGEMVDALGRVAGADPVGRIDWRPDPMIQKMVATWPGKFGWEKAKRLGMQPDADMDSIIRAFIEEDLGEPA